MSNSNSDFVQKALIAIALLVLSVVVIQARQLFLTLCMAVGLGVIFTPLVTKISETLRVPRFLASSLLFFSIVGIFIGATYLLIYIPSDDLLKFFENIPQALKEVEHRVASVLGEAPSIDGNEEAKARSMVVNWGERLLNYAGVGLGSGLGSMILIGLALVFSFYFTLSPDFYRAQIRLLLPKSKSQKYENLMLKCSQTLRRWFKAQLFDMIIVGLLTTIGLLFVGFEFWFAAGALTAIFCFLPYIGIFIVSGICIAVALTQSGEMALLVAVVFLVTQQVEGNLILPKVMKEQVALPEAPLLFFIALMGVFFGILGIIVAPPLFAIILLIVNEGIFPDMDPILQPKEDK